MDYERRHYALQSLEEVRNQKFSFSLVRSILPKREKKEKPKIESERFSGEGHHTKKKRLWFFCSFPYRNNFFCKSHVSFLVNFSNWNSLRTKKRWSPSTNTSCAVPSIPRIYAAMWKPFSSIDHSTILHSLIVPAGLLVASFSCLFQILFCSFLFVYKIRPSG